MKLNGIQALDKLDNTLCLNLNNKTLEFGIDKYDHCDCDNAEEMVRCYDTIEEELKDYEWLKSIIPVDAMTTWNLSSDDKLRLLKIMGVKL